ncbi:MAG: YggT family protein, partial [Woeseia sp.]|nr:YggT family protein [Woeseia sp.]
MTQALYFIVSTLAQLVLLLFLLRFWLPLLRVDFRNPLAQGVLRLTSPVITPVRRLLPPMGRVDTATVLVMLVLQFAVVMLLLYLSGRMFDPVSGRMIDPGSLATFTVLQLAIHSLYLFFFVVLISVILSWVAPQTYNPVVSMISAMAEPILRP